MRALEEFNGDGKRVRPYRPSHLEKHSQHPSSRAPAIAKKAGRARGAGVQRSPTWKSARYLHCVSYPACSVPASRGFHSWPRLVLPDALAEGPRRVVAILRQREEASAPNLRARGYVQALDISHAGARTLVNLRARKVSLRWRDRATSAHSSVFLRVRARRQPNRAEARPARARVRCRSR